MRRSIPRIMRPDRKRPIHLPLVEYGNRSPIVFLTVCTAGRKAVLARPAVHSLLVQAWTEAAHWRVGRYVAMPDHVHLFCSPRGESAASLQNWVHFWKRLTTRRWTEPTDGSIWQAGFWDRQLRTGESYDQKWNYVRENPVRHELVSRSEDWPYQGELNVLEWHEA